MNSVRSLGVAEMLLGRGASLYFGDLNQEIFSIGALVQLAKRHGDHFPFSKFRPFRKNTVTLDVTEPAPFYCLAAAAVTRSENDSELPDNIRSFIEAHRVLRRQIEGDICSSLKRGGSVLSDPCGEDSVGRGYDAPFDRSELPSDFD